MVDGARLASPSSIVSSRSITCGAACRSEPCTLRQIRHAERQLAAEPSLVLWAELGVVGHLIGQPMPVPVSDLLDALARLDPRHRECTISHAVDAAVASRTPVFARRLSPGALAQHVGRAINQWVVDNATSCTPSECRRWYVTDQTALSDRRRVLHGVDDPSAIETAVGCPAGGLAWPARLNRLLTDFVDSGWPARQLGGDR